MVLVVYFSKTGNTKKLVDGFVEGVARAGVSVVVKSVDEAKVEDLPKADAIVFASPSYFRLPAWPLKKFIDDSVEVYSRLNGKIGGALCTAASELGAIKCIQALKEVLEEHGIVFIGEGVWAIETPSTKDLEKAAKYGGEIARKLKER